MYVQDLNVNERNNKIVIKQDNKNQHALGSKNEIKRNSISKKKK